MSLTQAAPRRVYSNRTLNLRGIKAIGYDMDYTLVHYRVQEWERAAFAHACAVLAADGWPAADLIFDPESVTLGLTFDLELGNLVKATRFGYVVRAEHGTQPLTHDELREAYASTVVDLAEPRFEFMNTLFSLSQASIYRQLVDRLDQGELPQPSGYRELFSTVGAALDFSHTAGALKAQITANPDRFVEPDPELALTLLDQREAGKTLLLVTNSEWAYTDAMMSHALSHSLPAGKTWRDLFDFVIVDARKPAFFSGRQACYEIVDPAAGLLRPHRGALRAGGLYVGGDATFVESSLRISGSEILYVGDHLFGDVHVSKAMLRWRTALILRELEGEIAAMEAFAPSQTALAALMDRKTEADRQLAALRLQRLREKAEKRSTELTTDIRRAVARSHHLDQQIGVLARASGELGNPNWGPLMRAGSDKSLFARQVEKYADVYTSRVSNFLAETPFAYLRASRTSLPHD